MRSGSDSDPISTLVALFETKGALAYGERVSQLEHALQCAVLAERDGADDALVTAALLHDIGHLVHRDAGGAFAAGIDDRHELLGARYLQRWFIPAVVRPIALHVQAKRYRVACEPGYWNGLSEASRFSLQLQGGAMSFDELRHFGEQEGSLQALALRRWDDLGKLEGLRLAPLEHFIERARRCLKPPGFQTSS
jgi:phosphonate degradation associated HDIG domain protein